MTPQDPTRPQPKSQERRDPIERGAAMGAATHRRVLVIGATGMLGRPVVRRLIKEGFVIRAVVRDVIRARAVLPEKCQLVRGDVRDTASLESAMHGIDAVYTNLANPYSPREPFDPDRDGTPLIIEAAKRAGVNRFIRISAMGAPDAAQEWWLIDRKTMTDELALCSGLACTVLRPTWLMESLPLLKMGRLMFRVRTPDRPLWWLAGDDYARGVAAALRSDRAIGRAYDMQGPQGLSFDQAIDRFVAGWPKRLLVLPVPYMMLSLNRMFSAKAAYVDDLLKMTFAHTAVFRSQDAWDDLGKPVMTIEDYVRYVTETGNLPRK